MSVRSTSLEAYNMIKENGLLSKRKWEVYDILFRLGPLTAHEVVGVARENYPNANQTSFNARLSELVNLGCIEVVGEKINVTSGALNFLWDVNGRLPVKFEKPKKLKCKHCNGKGHFLE